MEFSYLPPDASGTIAMAAGSGKVALVKNSTALTGACPNDPNIVDIVGYGNTANCFKGSRLLPLQATPTLSSARPMAAPTQTTTLPISVPVVPTRETAFDRNHCAGEVAETYQPQRLKDTKDVLCAFVVENRPGKTFTHLLFRIGYS